MHLGCTPRDGCDEFHDLEDSSSDPALVTCSCEPAIQTQ